MLHNKLSTKPSQYFGVNINFDRTHVLLQLGDEGEQVRVMLTSEEVDRIIEDLKKRKSEIKK